MIPGLGNSTWINELSTFGISPDINLVVPDEPFIFEKLVEIWLENSTKWTTEPWSTNHVTRFFIKKHSIKNNKIPSEIHESNSGQNFAHPGSISAIVDHRNFHEIDAQNMVKVENSSSKMSSVTVIENTGKTNKSLEKRSC